MAKLTLIAAAVLGFMGIGLGAFGAHALRARISSELLTAYQTGVFYHLVHALALLAAGLLMRQGIDSLWLKCSALAFCCGTLLFSGSLYMLAVSAVRAWGAVTPFGGLLFLIGWLSMAIAVWRNV
jgi:uncharacterized membrane protein YgdD (TMEM256/DUF423 family)